MHTPGQPRNRQKDPGENVNWIDTLDKKARKVPRKNPQTPRKREPEPKEESAVSYSKDWLPPRDSNPDMLIQSQLSCR